MDRGTARGGVDHDAELAGGSVDGLDSGSRGGGGGDGAPSLVGAAHADEVGLELGEVAGDGGAVVAGRAGRDGPVTGGEEAERERERDGERYREKSRTRVRKRNEE